MVMLVPMSRLSPFNKAGCIEEVVADVAYVADIADVPEDTVVLVAL